MRMHYCFQQWLIANILQDFPKYIFQMQWYFLLAKVVHSELALLRKTLKTLYETGNHGCNATQI